MPTEEQWRDRLDTLLDELLTLPEEQFLHDRTQQSRLHRREIALASGWLASANALVEAVLPNENAPHRRAIDLVTGNGANFEFREQMMRVGAILEAVRTDIDAGLFQSVANQAAALVFADWLDHARDFLASDQKDIAGVLASIAFEDTMRKLRAIHQVEPADIKLDLLISELGKRDALTALERKEAVAAAGLRNSAAHARWEDFDAHQVSATIELTRRFLSIKFN